MSLSRLCQYRPLKHTSIFAPRHVIGHIQDLGRATWSLNQSRWLKRWRDISATQFTEQVGSRTADTINTGVNTGTIARRQHRLGVSAARATDQVQRETPTLPYTHRLRGRYNGSVVIDVSVDGHKTQYIILELQMREQLSHGQTPRLLEGWTTNLRTARLYSRASTRASSNLSTASWQRDLHDERSK